MIDDIDLDSEVFHFATSGTDLFESAPALEPQVEEDQPVLFELTLPAKVEAVVFASPKAITPQEILEVVQTDDSFFTLELIEDTLAELEAFYRERRGGFCLEKLPDGYQFRSVNSAGFLMERLFASRPRTLSRAALETLAIIVYKQPITRATIDFIRGVDGGNIIKTLIDKNLIKCVGRRDEAGKPMLFGTTDEFLKVFGLRSLAELPPLASFQPSQEALKNANTEADEETDDIDIAEYVEGEEGDPAQEMERIQGATSKLQELQGDDGDHESTEMDLDAGSGFEERSGEVDSGEESQD
jgi:segregation and condensation protein B